MRKILVQIFLFLQTQKFYMNNKSENFRMIAKTISGLEGVLASELSELGATEVRAVVRGVEFYGDQRLLYKANYLCRTTLRILKPIATFRAENEDQLYREIYKIDWSKYLDVNGTFSVDGVTSYSNITHSKYLALKTKDAVVDQFRANYGKRPNVRLDNADLVINVRIFRDECTVSIDSSGESLHKRGYRKATGPAPISEVLAAGMILLTGWDRESNFIDPMCGSGTIPIEAALIARNIPAGYFREDYCFMHWKDFDKDLWNEIKSEAETKIIQPKAKIVGSDKSGLVIGLARQNLRSAGLTDNIHLKASFFADLEPPSGGGILVMNPPYDERMKNDDIIQFYKEIGNTFKQKYQGYQAWVISGHMEALKLLGLHATRNITLFNGPLECRFARFVIYEGSKKRPQQDEPVIDVPAKNEKSADPPKEERPKRKRIKFD
jgi:putative N6-adenine-specific DNA methylase